MGYASNNKFHPLTDDINLVIDGCGETYEKKYYYNGTYIDLCGMSIEEYMKNPCCGGGNGGSEDYVKPINEILVKTFEDESGTIYYQAFAKFAVTSTIKINVTSSTNIVTELDLYVGDTTSKPEIGETSEIINITLSVYEDDSYEYVSVSEENKVSYDIYYKAIPLSEIGTFSSDLNIATMVLNSSADLIFTIPGSDINYNEMTDMSEIEKYYKEHEYCLLLCLPKDIYTNKQFVLSNYGGSDVTKNFTFNNYLTINGVDYACMVEKSKSELDSTMFVQLYNEDSIFQYKLTLTK